MVSELNENVDLSNFSSNLNKNLQTNLNNVSVNTTKADHINLTEKEKYK